MRSSIISVIVTILISVANLGWCSSLADLVNQMRTGKAQLAETKSEMDTLTGQNERDLKEHTAYNESFIQLEAQKKILKENFWKEANGRLAEANSIVTGYNSKCSGELDEPTYKSCGAELARLEPVVNAIRDGVARDAAAFTKGQITPIEETQKIQKKAMEELSIRMKGRFEKWLKVQEKNTELTAQLENIRSALIDACSSARSAESLKHCNSIGWDGARKDLPPLTEIRPPFAVTPN